MYLQAFELIRSSKSVALVSHINPDADALGSSLGMYWLLKTANVRCTPVNVSEPPSLLDFLPGIAKLKSALPPDCDLVISFDCGSFERLGIPKADYKLINIDHHVSNDSYGDINIVDPKAASTASVVLAFAKECGLSINEQAGTCLYAALASDTGFFRYENSNATAFRDAAMLVEAGANAGKIAQKFFDSTPLAQLRLQSAIIDNLHLCCDAKAAFSYYDQALLSRTGATKDDAEGMAEMLRSLSSVEVSMLLREEKNGDVRGSFRSKNYVDVNALAAHFGGGGHMRAAGFTYKGDAEDNFETKRQKLYKMFTSKLLLELCPDRTLPRQNSATALAERASRWRIK